MKNHILILALPLLLTACVTTTTVDQKSVTNETPVKAELTLAKIQSVDLRAVNATNANSMIGESDLQGLGPRGTNQEMHVYLTQSHPPSTIASLFYDMNTKALMSVKWYVKNESEADFSSLKNRYPGTQLLVNKKSKKLTEVTILVRPPAKKTPARK